MFAIDVSHNGTHIETVFEETRDAAKKAAYDVILSSQSGTIDDALKSGGWHMQDTYRATLKWVYGTSYFESRESVIAYYRKYRFDNVELAVAAKLAGGEIHIGKPLLKVGEACQLDREEGRYFIRVIERILTSRQKEALEFAEHAKALGFRAFLAECGEYGFITDSTESRVLLFGFGTTPHLSGSYYPPSTQNGTGWRMNGLPTTLMTKDEIRDALYAMPPEWTRRDGPGWKRVSTMADYLSMYGKSSRFTEI